MEKDAVQLFKVILDFVETLTDEQIDALRSRRVHLSVDSIEKMDVLPNNGESRNIDEIAQHLNKIKKSEDAIDYLERLPLSRSQLKELAEHYNVPLLSKDSMKKQIRKIVESVIGSKIRFNSLLYMNAEVHS